MASTILVGIRACSTVCRPIGDTPIVSLAKSSQALTLYLNKCRSWDWTDREFNKKLFSPAYMGGNGGHDGRGGAVVTGPFTLNGGWVVNSVLHRVAWFVRDPTNPTMTVKDGDTWKVQPSLGRSLVRYMGDFEDLATNADIIEFTKRKSAFGPEKLVLRADIIPHNPSSTGDPPESSPEGFKMPRGTFLITNTQTTTHAVASSPILVDQTAAPVAASGGNQDPPVYLTDRAFRK